MADFCLSPGTVLQSANRNYTILKVLTQGNLGIIYLAEGIITNGKRSYTTRFELKEFFVYPSCSRDAQSQRMIVSPTAADETGTMLRAFIDGARKLTDSGISHPNMEKVYEVFESNDTAYLATEHIEGETLASYVARKGQLSLVEMAELMAPVCQCVGLLHQKNLTHRDIQPENILLVNDCGRMQAVLTNFNLTKDATADDVHDLSSTMLFCLNGGSPQNLPQMSSANVRKELTRFNIQPSVIEVLLSALK